MPASPTQSLWGTGGLKAETQGLRLLGALHATPPVIAEHCPQEAPIPGCSGFAVFVARAGSGVPVTRSGLHCSAALSGVGMSRCSLRGSGRASVFAWFSGTGKKASGAKQGPPGARWEETPAGLLSPRAGGLDFFDDWPFSAELGAQGKDCLLLAGAGGSQQ